MQGSFTFKGGKVRLSRARAEGVRVSCASNLHQIGVCLRLYVDDGQKFPFFQAGVPATRSNFWDAKLVAYAGGNECVFMCPGNTELTRNSTVTNWLMFGVFMPNASYGYNSFGVMDVSALLGLSGLAGRAVAESKVLAASDMVAVGDYYPVDPTPSLYPTLTGNHHSGRANVVFCDAHVEYAKTNMWMAPTDPARKRWNNDHRPH